jgi:hypothetical protein
MEDVWGRVRTTHGREGKAWKVLVANLEARPLGRTIYKWEDNIKTDLKEIGWGAVDWTQMAQDRGQCRNMVMPLKSHNIQGIS